MNTALNRSVVIVATNKSGGDLAQGAVGILGSATANAFTTTTTLAYKNSVPCVVIEPNGIANNASGLVAVGGYVPKINLSGSASLYDFIKTHTVAGQGVRHAAPSVSGDFAIALETGASPKAVLFGTPNLSAIDLIDSVNPSGTGTVTFASIPQIYNSLEIHFVARSEKAAVNVDELLIEFNGDTTASNYRNTYDQGYGATTVSAVGADSKLISNISAAASPSNSPGSGKIFIPNYAGTVFNKMATGLSGYRYDASSIHVAAINAALEWENAAAITQIILKLAADNFVTGSKFDLYGIR